MNKIRSTEYIEISRLSGFQSGAHRHAWIGTLDMNTATSGAHAAQLSTRRVATVVTGVSFNKNGSIFLNVMVVSGQAV